MKPLPSKRASTQGKITSLPCVGSFPITLELAENFADAAPYYIYVLVCDRATIDMILRLQATKEMILTVELLE
jgi:hypothetical protein